MPMVYEDGNYLTDKGRRLITKCLAEKNKIDFTRVTIGSGTIPDGKTPKTMTTLAKHQADGLISSISTPVPDEAHLVFQIFSQDVAVGFFASEAAVWASDPDDGEILYSYIVIANSPEWIRASSDSVQKFAEFTCISIVGAAPVGMTQISPQAIVTREALEKRLAAIVSCHWIQIAQRPRDPDLPDYKEGGLALRTAPYTGGAEIAVQVEKRLYDAENMSARPQTAQSGTIIIRKVED